MQPMRIIVACDRRLVLNCRCNAGINLFLNPNELCGCFNSIGDLARLKKLTASTFHNDQLSNLALVHELRYRRGSVPALLALHRARCSRVHSPVCETNVYCTAPLTYDGHQHVCGHHSTNITHRTQWETKRQLQHPVGGGGETAAAAAGRDWCLPNTRETVAPAPTTRAGGAAPPRPPRTNRLA